MSEQPLQTHGFVSAPTSPSSETLSRRTRYPVLLAAWISASLAALLVLSELLAADIALAWAVGGMLGLTRSESWLAVGIGALISIWVAACFFRSALAGEISLTRGTVNTNPDTPDAIA